MNAQIIEITEVRGSELLGNSQIVLAAPNPPLEVPSGWIEEHRVIPGGAVVFVDGGDVGYMDPVTYSKAKAEAQAKEEEEGIPIPTKPKAKK